MENDGVGSADNSSDDRGSRDSDDGPSVSEESREALDGGGDDDSDSDGPSATGGSDDGGGDTGGDDGSGDAEPEDTVDPNEPTPAERAASQERLEAEARAAQSAYDARQGYEAEAYGHEVEVDFEPDGPAADAAGLDAAEVEAEEPPVESPIVGNTPGADFLNGEPLTEAAQQEMLDEAQADFEAAAVELAEIDAAIEAEVFAAELAFEPETYEVPSGIPGIPEYAETEFDPEATRAEIEATYADQRRAAEFAAQSALNRAAVAGGIDGLNQMRNAAVQALGDAGFGDAEILDATSEGALGPEGYARADAFARAADAWGSGGAADVAYNGNALLNASTAELAAYPPNAGNPRLAANLDAIVGNLQAAGQPELAADMRLYAVTQLGDAIYAGETGNHGDVMAIVRDAEPVTDLAAVAQASLSRTPEGQAALDQFQNLMDPQRLNAMDLRTGEPLDAFTGLSPQRPGTPERPLGGYPDVIRETIGPHIDAAIEARGMAGLALAATLVLPGPEDLAIAGIVAGGARVARGLDGLFDATRAAPGNGVDDPIDAALDPFRRQAADVPPVDEAAPPRTGVVEERRQTVLAGHPTAEIVSGHRNAAGQIDHFTVRIDGQTWHIPAGRTLDDLPDVDPIGDRIQEFATDAAARWDRSELSIRERAAIDAAYAADEPYLGRMLEAQARGRWVETEVRELMNLDGIPNTRPAQGLDFIDPNTGLQYDIMSGTAGNITTHARREGTELFRMITF